MNRLEMLKDELRLLRRDTRSAYNEIDEMEWNLEESEEESNILYLEIEENEKRIGEIVKEIKIIEE